MKQQALRISVRMFLICQVLRSRQFVCQLIGFVDQDRQMLGTNPVCGAFKFELHQWNTVARLFTNQALGDSRIHFFTLAC